MCFFIILLHCKNWLNKQQSITQSHSHIENTKFSPLSHIITLIVCKYLNYKFIEIHWLIFLQVQRNRKSVLKVHWSLSATHLKYSILFTSRECRQAQKKKPIWQAYKCKQCHLKLFFKWMKNTDPIFTCMFFKKVFNYHCSPGFLSTPNTWLWALKWQEEYCSGSCWDQCSSTSSLMPWMRGQNATSASHAKELHRNANAPIGRVATQTP